MTLQLDNEYFPIHSVETEFSCITKFNSEIQQSIILLNKLSKLLQEEKLTSKSFTQISAKYQGKLDNNIKLRNIYHEKIMNESKDVEMEYASVISEKELLLAKKNINDIGEEEFSLKFKVVEWDMEFLNKKKMQLNEGLNLINSLKRMLSPEDVSEISLIADDEFKMPGIDDETHLRLVSLFGKINGIIS